MSDLNARGPNPEFCLRHYNCIAGTMNASSKDGAGLQFDAREFECSPSGSSSSLKACSSSQSTARSKHVKYWPNFFDDPYSLPSVYFFNMDYFKAFQDRLRQVNQNVPHNSTVESESYVHSLTEDMSQQPHVLSNEEFLELMQSPPPRQFHPPSQQRPPFFSFPNSQTQTPASLPVDSQPAIGRTAIVIDSQPAVRSTPEQGSSEPVEKVNPAPVEKTGGKKRAPTKKPTKKAKKGKTKAASDDDEDGDDAGSMRWIDAEVTQLIAFRNEMDEEFRANAKKQGKNTWDKLQGRMIATCENFAKSAEACRKKWDALYRQYCTDKRILQISGEGRKITCRFFENIDQGFNNLANVRKVVHGDAEGTPNLYPPDLNQPIEGQGSGGNAAPGGVHNPTSDPNRPSALSPQGSNAPKKSNGDHISSLMTGMITQTKEMVNQTSLMVVQTTNLATDIRGNSSVLTDLRLDLARLIDKL